MIEQQFDSNVSVEQEITKHQRKITRQQEISKL